MNSNPCFVVMMYFYSGVHNYEEDNFTLTFRRELKMAVPVLVTEVRGVAESFIATACASKGVVYDIVVVPVESEAIPSIIEGFNKRREVHGE